MTVELFDVPLARLTPGDFVTGCAAEDLVYFLLNVGDGDCQLLLLPAAADGTRQALVVDVATVAKLPALLDALAATPLLPATDRPIALVVATHPHDDHIGGVASFIRRFHAQIDELWEPGYVHTSAAYIEMMRAIEDHTLRHLQPTSGTTRFIGHTKVTALSPGVALRNRFDSYGIDANNSSIALRVEFPVSRVVQRGARRELLRHTKTQSLILGADAQTLSWAQVMVDFPQLGPVKTVVNDALKRAGGFQPLDAAVFKIPHHGSKHGVNLELVEQINPAVSLISSVAGGGEYNFPHAFAMEAVREGVKPLAEKGTAHPPDPDLGIHYTSQRDAAGALLGTIAVVLSPGGRRRRLWRFGDAPGDPIDLAAARRFE